MVFTEGERIKKKVSYDDVQAASLFISIIGVLHKQGFHSIMTTFLDFIDLPWSFSSD